MFLFPNDSLSVYSYISTGNGTSTILAAPASSTYTLLYYSLEKTGTVGELHLHSDLVTTTPIGHLDNTGPEQFFTNQPFQTLSLERNSVGTNDSFVHAIYVPYSLTSSVDVGVIQSGWSINLLMVIAFVLVLDFIRRIFIKKREAF